MAHLQFYVKAELHEQFNNLLKQSGEKNNGAFLEALIDNWQNPKLKDGIDPTVHQELQEQLDQANAKYQEMADNYDAILNTVKDKSHENEVIIKSLEEALEAAKQQLSEIEQSAPKPGAIIIYPDEITRHLLNICVEIETKNTKKPVSMGDILITLFMYQIIQGPGDHLQRRWSTYEIEKLQQKIKQSSGE